MLGDFSDLDQNFIRVKGEKLSHDKSILKKPEVKQMSPSPYLLILWLSVSIYYGTKE